MEPAFFQQLFFWPKDGMNTLRENATLGNQILPGPAHCIEFFCRLVQLGYRSEAEQVTAVVLEELRKDEVENSLRHAFINRRIEGLRRNVRAYQPCYSKPNRAPAQAVDVERQDPDYHVLRGK